MAEKLDLKDIVTLEELTPSNMWGIASLVEVLESKGKFHKGKGSARDTVHWRRAVIERTVLREWVALACRAT